MAQCPQCADSPLVHTMLAEGLPAYGCGRCLGTLVSLVTYRAWRERVAESDVPGTAALISDAAPADSVGAKNCPKCLSLMSKYRFSAARANRLDYCAHCEEIWLDDGEWQLVESLVMSGEFTKVFTQAWQYAMRADIQGAMAGQRLRELLGPEYERFVGFSRWLATQPARQELLAHLAQSRLPSGERGIGP